MSRLTVLTGTALLVVTMAARAHTPSQPPHQLFNEGDLKLESGEVIKDFSISYVTHGTLNANKSNAILMVTAISGNHHRIDFMIGPGKALDPDKYFIIATDAIANGLTTSPSNSTAQPRMLFPKFTIRDMVESQYRLLKEKFGIEHLVAVVGPSMGGMQTLQWGVSHPDMMDGLVAMVPLARRGLWRSWRRRGEPSCLIPRGMAGITQQSPIKESGCGAIFSIYWPPARPICTKLSSRTGQTSCHG